MCDRDGVVWHTYRRGVACVRFLLFPLRMARGFYWATEDGRPEKGRPRNRDMKMTDQRVTKLFRSTARRTAVCC